MSDTNPVPEKKSGAIASFTESKKYGISGVVVLSCLGLSGEAIIRGDSANAIAGLWVAAAVVASYNLGQGLVDFAKEWKK